MTLRATMKTTNWFLFSAANDYNQPAKAFEAYWSEKPTIEQVSKVMQVDLSKARSDHAKAVVRAWTGDCGTIYGIDYWLEELEPNK